MKKTVKFAVCLLVLAVLLGVLFGVSRINREEEMTAEETETIPVTGDEEEEVTAVSFRIGEQEVSFSRKDDVWSYDQDPEFPLKQTSIDNIVSKAVALEAEQVLEDSTVDPADYGLDEPSQVIQYTVGEETTKISIGDENATTSLWYVSLNDSTEKIYLVNQGFDSMFPDDIMSFAQGESLPDIDASTITNITVESENGYRIDTVESGWSVTDQEGFTHDADSEQVETLTGTLSSMSYGGMKEYQCTDMSLYGLEEPKAVVTVNYTEEQTVEDSETSEDGAETSEDTETAGSTEEEISDASETETITVEKELVLLIGNQKEDGTYYVTTKGSAEVHTLSQDTVEAVLGTEASEYWDLAVSPVTVTDIRSLEIVYQGNTNTIVRKTEETEEEDGSTTETVTYTWNDEEVDKTEASTLCSAAVSMQAQSKSKDLKPAQENEIVLTMYTDDASYTVSYSPYDSSFYYAEDLQGVPSLINKNDVNTLINSYLTVIGER